MLLKAALTTTFVTAALSAALPATHYNTRSLEKRDYITQDTTWSTNGRTTDEEASALDDAWTKYELEFPMTIYDKSSSTIWVSMNGLMCVDDPTGLGPSVPPRNLPVDPSNCNDGGCIPNNCLALFWDDLYMPRTNHITYQLHWTYHIPNTTAPEIGEHYHILFRACSKTSLVGDVNPYDACPTDGVRTITMDLFAKQPGRFHIGYVRMKDGVQGIIGAQSYSGQGSPRYLQTTKPNNFGKGQYPDTACLIVDTQTNVITVPTDSSDC
ncbi:hypothetical protein TWF696_001833 [Orbilia brochopaga]|uniref:Uncharacterized protein n=1 Tax=Orbilia brochopaga TaxID=3140254 RepID=A0AAV9U6P4_9PEZI